MRKTASAFSAQSIVVVHRPGRWRARRCTLREFQPYSTYRFIKLFCNNCCLFGIGGDGRRRDSNGLIIIIIIEIRIQPGAHNSISPRKWTKRRNVSAHFCFILYARSILFNFLILYSRFLIYSLSIRLSYQNTRTFFTKFECYYNYIPAFPFLLLLDNSKTMTWISALLLRWIFRNALGIRVFQRSSDFVYFHWNRSSETPTRNIAYIAYERFYCFLKFYNFFFFFESNSIFPNFVGMSVFNLFGKNRSLAC